MIGFLKRIRLAWHVLRGRPLVYGMKTDARGAFVHPRLGVAGLRESWDPERVPEPEQPEQPEP